MPDSGFDPRRSLLAAPTSSAPSFGPIARMVEILSLWRRRAIERDQLAHFDDRALRDIAITRAEVTRELEKPFWRG